ncbi:hypothetical protein METBIDRAFT_41554 [Metschnikowia bicuspidata var. bicuspidata NRRL YB-4993]|uniref:Altered inheritance of mitochondria protein 18, mitochondrial n=1 Tax=Metschnikowia bicuspidata var. bicuspidata NRRL YB-4993 TaxID=869754 RepID=A0A1A0HBX6_9ASCO|nr:hypothetical protein METBIDRAFT_41554 [Metschnikowia bicuspidata var. bicuspidata NRRL YB-4993]OBA21485.1 hypothetical protein METBIDRAFT_41554 [Metschnikowia bicuspidata var. bicuspidata NRRL YB-4993]
MWTPFRTSVPRLSLLKRPRNSGAWKASLATVSLISLFLGGSIIANDHSNRSLEGVAVDPSIEPFPNHIASSENTLFSSDYKLIASGVRSVTFMSFKVYGVGLYIPAKSEKTLVSVISEYLKAHPEQTAQSVLEDKTTSQELVAQICQNVPYAMKITPVRNTDYGHLRDGLTKSILANPMAKALKEEVSKGVEELRNVFLEFRGSVPKNDTLWVVSDTSETTIAHEGKSMKTMGSVMEPVIARVLLVLYLSSAKPLSEPLRKDFVRYIGGLC